MKKMVLIFIFQFGCIILGFTQNKQTTSPVYSSKHQKNTKIEKIEITNQYTIVRISYTKQSKWSTFKLKKSYIIANNKKYKIIKSDIDRLTGSQGYDIGDDLKFNFYYKPIPAGIENIDIVLSVSQAGTFYWDFNGIQINNPLQNEQLYSEKENREIKKEAVSQPLLVSDIDYNIPVTNKVNDLTFAVIIGNENYAKEIKVNFALNDSKIFNEYLNKTIGLPKKNIFYIENGTYGQILDALKWINDVIKSYKGQAKVIFYYAGHGMPDEQSKSAFILPVDGNSQNTQTAVKLSDVYGKLTEFPSISITVFLDACFSGSSRETNETMLAQGRGVKIKPKNDLLTGNIVVFSAATGDETAFPYTEKQHGMFTYFLLKKLQDSKGSATLYDLSSYIITNVTQQTVVVNKKSQTPQVNMGSQVQNIWQTIRLK